ncbi:MAG: hypothetical protein ACTHKL_04065 [Streptosporangiaceae bacterium]
MNPPAEQLIRDYLNRLSLAAKAGLEPADRQALLDHTRARIDAECGGITNPTAAQVRRTLAGLGDPIALVGTERSRVAARKAWDKDAASDPAKLPESSQPVDAVQPRAKEAAAGSRASGSQRQVWPPPVTPAIAQRLPTPPVILPPATANAQGSAVRLTTTIPPAPAGPPVLAGSQLPAGFAAPASQASAGRPLSAGESAPMQPVSASHGPWAGPPVSPGQVSGDQEASAADDSSSAASDSARTSPGTGDSASRPGPARPASPPSPGGQPPATGTNSSRGVPARVTPAASGSEPAPSGGAGRREGSCARSNGISPRQRPPWPASENESAVNEAARPTAERGAFAADQPPVTAAGSKANDQDLPGVEFSIDPSELEVLPSRLAVIGGAIGRRLRRVGAALLIIAQRDRLEAIAILLLGVGGAIYQPVWLIGVFVAIASKKWDLRDKWLGLALPVLAVIIGTALEITLGARLPGYRPYLVEAWVAAGRLSRIAAVLSALYLLWRVHKYQGSPTRRLPPWTPQRKPGR